MTYRTPSLGDDLQFDTGANLLISGPAHRAADAMYDVLADGLAAEQSAIVVSTDESGDKVITTLSDRVHVSADRLGIIDATGESETRELDEARVRALSSPQDLTGLSLEFAKLLQALDEYGAADEVRVGIGSVSTLLMYADVQTVFRFLHVFTSRIRSAELFGAFALDPEMHDDTTTNTVRAIFDAEAQITEAGVDVRGSGFTHV